MCCSVLRSGADCCSVLQCVAAMLMSDAMLTSSLLFTFRMCVAVCCSALLCVLGRTVDIPLQTHSLSYTHTHTRTHAHTHATTTGAGASSRHTAANRRPGPGAQRVDGR